MSDQTADQQNQDIDNTDIENLEGSEGEIEVEHEVILVEGDSPSPNEEIPFSNAAAAQRRVAEKEVKNALIRENDKIAQLQQQNVEIMQQLQQQQQQQPPQQSPVPTVSDYGFDQSLHTEAVVNWVKNSATDSTGNAVSNQVDAGAVAAEAIAKYQKNLTADQQNKVDEGKFTAHYNRASKLKIKDYVATEEIAMKNLGDTLAQAIQLAVPGSERVLYHLGKNTEKAMKLKNLYDVDPTQATIELGVLSGQLHTKPKSKNSAEPETRLTGGTGGANTKHYPDTKQGEQQKRRAAALKGTSWS